MKFGILGPELLYEIKKRLSSSQTALGPSERVVHLV